MSVNFSELAFGIVSLWTGVLSLVLAVAVFLGNPSLRVNRAWAVAGGSTGLWAAGLAFAILSPDKKTSLIWNQVFYFGGVWIPTTFLWFVSNFTNKPVRKSALLLSGLISLFLTFILIFKFEWFVVDLVPRGPFRFWEVLGPCYQIFSIFFFAGMIFSIWRLFKNFRFDESVGRKKFGLFFLGISVGVLGGSTTFFYDYNINIFPFGQFFVFLYPLLISWAIVKHQALDIGILFKKTSLLIGVYGCLLGSLVPMILIVHRQFGSSSSYFTLLVLIEIVLAAFILSLGPFIYAFLIRRTVSFHEHTLAGITHELKSPLAIMENALEILRGKLTPLNLKKSDWEYFEIVDRNRHRLQNYVEDLLGVYKVSGKKEILDIKPVDFCGLCEYILNGYRTAADAKGLMLVYKSEFKESEFPCDEDKIRQVISNLVSNAIKYTPSGSVTLELGKSNREISVSVRDTGIGISKADLPFIFDRFFQGQGTSQAKGTGLGLAIAKMWVEAHGGRIWAESKGEGKGTIISFVLPAS